VAVWEYSGAARGTVLAFKYGENPGLAVPLAEAAAAVAGHRLTKNSLLVPVPLHARRRRERGFDAVQELARQLGKLLGLRAARPLERPLPTVPQSGMGRAARARNAQNSFRIVRPEAVFGHPVVLVDDVMTTGATAAACARLVLGAGATSVGVLAMARARLD
jgi:ComF family protein